MKQADRLRRNQRRLLRRFRQHGISGGQSRGDLSGEDREWEIPRADADGGTTRRMRRGERVSSLRGVVPAKIDRFPDLRDGVRHGLARLADEKGAQPFHGLLDEVAAAFEDSGPFARACLRPSRRSGRGEGHRRFDILFGCGDRMACGVGSA